MRPSFCKSTFWPDNRTVCVRSVYTHHSNHPQPIFLPLRPKTYPVPTTYPGIIIRTTHAHTAGDAHHHPTQTSRQGVPIHVQHTAFWRTACSRLFVPRATPACDYGSAFRPAGSVMAAENAQHPGQRTHTICAQNQNKHYK